MGGAYVGTSGWDYPGWRGRFFPADVPKRAWLSYLTARTTSLELNGTFYSLKRPDHFRRLVEESPPGYRFAVKGSRFVTHMKKLRDCETPLANFYAQGVLALHDKTGPFLWQLPEMVAYDGAKLRDFVALLPRTTGEAAALARRHDHRMAGRALLDVVDPDVPLQHAFEPRHASWFCDGCFRALADAGCAFVVADSAGRFPRALVASAPFLYARLHGSKRLYTSRYEDDELDEWATTVRRRLQRGGDAYVYFDNDALGHAPYDAVRLLQRVRARPRVSELRPPG